MDIKRELQKFYELKKLYIFTSLGILAADVFVTILFSFLPEMKAEYITIILIVFYGALSIFAKVVFIAYEVPRCLCFGMTRKKCFKYGRIYDFAETFLAIMIGIIVLKGGYAMLALKIGVLFLGITMWVEATAANGTLVIGKAAYFVFYIVFMFFSFVVPKLVESMPPLKAFLIWFVKALVMPTTSQQILGWLCILALFISGFALNWITFRKVPVTMTA